MAKIPERLGDAPIEEKYIEQMTAIMTVLDSFMNEGTKGPVSNSSRCSKK